MKRMTKKEIANLLRGLADLVESGDSAEGSFQYLISREDENWDYLEVEASYRIGNLDGQGGMVIL